MDMYEILKVLNHNTILVLKENEEIIVMSKGIGFGKKQGASTCAGALTLGWSVHDAMELASAYVADTIAETRREPDARWYGVSFEATIPQLLRRMAQRRPTHAEN